MPLFSGVHPDCFCHALQTSPRVVKWAGAAPLRLRVRILHCDNATSGILQSGACREKIGRDVIPIGYICASANRLLADFKLGASAISIRAGNRNQF
jgi:hypothetical protein